MSARHEYIKERYIDIDVYANKRLVSNFDSLGGSKNHAMQSFKMSQFILHFSPASVHCTARSTSHLYPKESVVAASVCGKFKSLSLLLQGAAWGKWRRLPSLVLADAVYGNCSDRPWVFQFSANAALRSVCAECIVHSVCVCDAFQLSAIACRI